MFINRTETKIGLFRQTSKKNPYGENCTFSLKSTDVPKKQQTTAIRDGPLPYVVKESNKAFRQKRNWNIADY
jgi:hypothetical protein